MPLSVLLDGIRINAVSPGMVETPILRGAASYNDRFCS
jgi:hypothetical protein